jgi:lipopolysaccharide transport system permease protein
VLQPRSGWEAVDLAELWRGRELFSLLIWRDISIRYKQTILGGLWAILQPLIAMLIFTIFFGRVAGIRDSRIPYPLFAYSGLLLWTFFANSVTASSNSLVGNQVLVSKVYFPRLFIPLASMGALLLDLCMGFLLLVLMMLIYKWHFSVSMLIVPAFVLGTFLAAGGLGLFLSALNVRFRDVKYVVPYFVQLGLFVSPVIYPLQYVPQRYRSLFALNPMTGMISGFRSCLLDQPIEWRLVGFSFALCAGLFVVGLFLFRRMERRFADII